ncbi:hypothetical protein RBH29_12105 [Herbivorax sp. ANBcel31]|nr:hypothetical protein [Herbivorax sp. ANBcel31]MDQ2087170.1 hypothetical protein [Herbivorax sp. ANBcel31]
MDECNDTVKLIYINIENCKKGARIKLIVVCINEIENSGGLTNEAK